MGDRLAGRARADLPLSAVGLGTYLGEATPAVDELYEAAIARALALGCNVLDTAINYRNQLSERAIGRALAAAVAAGRCRREDVVVASKGGFLPRGTSPAAWKDVVAGCHCMTPAYLADQLERSRANLGLDTIDIYYVHNPETQLDEVAQGEFLRRMRAAFEALEGACAGGKIARYGTATWNGYRVPASDREHLSLAALVGLAREIAGDGHHFRALQLPYNLAMPEAAVRKNQVLGGRPVTLLDAARGEGLYVMTSASVMQGRLTQHLPAQVQAGLGLGSDAQRALQFARSTPGVGTALAGMKTVAHVEDNLAVLRHPPAAPAAIAALLPS